MNLLIPCSSIYQVIQFSKLEKKYTDCLNALECSTAEIGSEFIARLPHPEAEDFYNTCCAIDRFNADGYLAFLAKAVTGISIMILFAPTVVGFVGIGIALEGCFQGAYSLYQCQKIRWHTVEEFHQENPNGLKLRYDRTTRVIYR